MQYNQYQQMHYAAKFPVRPKVKYVGNWDLIYMGQYVVRNAHYAICKKAKIELEKNKYTIKKLIFLTHAK